VSPAITAEPIEMPFGLRTARVGPRNEVLDGGSYPPWEGAILKGEVAADCKVGNRNTLWSSVQNG